ncbi:MAG: ABC transporter permease subunit [Gammaproteobacteria bacterium]|jgi:ABC-type transport system involved in multi-copper enzyme maturation permease subunit|nr:ABC transporter permease subunit [Gammaproteobacteria bacterium]
MNGLLVAIKSEIFVALRTFANKLIVAAPSLVAAAQLLLVKLTDAGQQARDSLLGGSGFEQSVANNAYGFFVDGLTTGLTMLGLLLVAQGAYSFSYDRDIGSIRHLLIRRVSRSSMLTAKLIHLHLLALLSVLLLLSTSYLLSGILWEFSAIVEDGFELISEQEIREEIWLGLRLALVPLPAAIAFGLLISVSTQSATQGVTTALGITLAIDIFKGLLGDMANYLYASFQPSLIDQSYLQSVSRIVRGYSDVLIDDSVLQLNMWVPFPALLLFFAAALWIVQRRKI